MPEEQQVENLCPFGCGIENLDPNGYCNHLIGWTADKKMVDRREVVRGREVCNGKKKEKILPKDVIVLRPKGSPRVYRQGATLLRDEPLESEMETVPSSGEQEETL